MSLPVERRAALVNASRRHGDESHQALYGDRLAAAGLPNDGKRLPRVHVKADTPHSLNDTAIGLEVYVQIVDLK